VAHKLLEDTKTISSPRSSCPSAISTPLETRRCRPAVHLINNDQIRSQKQPSSRGALALQAAPNRRTIRFSSFHGLGRCSPRYRLALRAPMSAPLHGKRSPPSSMLAPASASRRRRPVPRCPARPLSRARWKNDNYMHYLEILRE
jgi:hypothetical protein